MEPGETFWENGENEAISGTNWSLNWGENVFTGRRRDRPGYVGVPEGGGGSDRSQGTREKEE